MSILFLLYYNILLYLVALKAPSKTGQKQTALCYSFDDNRCWEDVVGGSFLGVD
jgi:hypothetical protein